MQTCEKDPGLLTKLVEKPEEVTKEYEVALESEELEQLLISG
jgi:hypothetical protein